MTRREGDSYDPAAQAGGLKLDRQLGEDLMARALATLFAAGATLALVTVALPHSSRANNLGLLLIIAAAYLVAGVLFWRACSISRAILRIALALGSSMIAGVAYLSAQAPSPLIFFFLWVFLYSAYFLSNAETALQIAYVGAVFGVSCRMCGSNSLNRERRAKS